MGRTGDGSQAGRAQHHPPEQWDFLTYNGLLVPSLELIRNSLHTTQALNNVSNRLGVIDFLK